jgi:hypothetical protein
LHVSAAGLHAEVQVEHSERVSQYDNVRYAA